MTSRTTRGQSKHMNRLERAKPGTPYAPQRAAADGNHNSTASTEIIELPCQDLRSSSTGGTAPLAAPSALRQSTNGRDNLAHGFPVPHGQMVAEVAYPIFQAVQPEPSVLATGGTRCRHKPFLLPLVSLH